MRILYTGILSKFSFKKTFASLGEIIYKSIWFGFIAGMISGMAKIGWEALLPLRTTARNFTNPPQHMLEQFAVLSFLTHSCVLYSKDQKVFCFSLILHFTFSIFFAALFVFIAQYWKTIALWQGMLRILLFGSMAYCLGLRYRSMFLLFNC